VFNLLMSGAGWEPNRDTFTRSRVLEYTSQLLQQEFMRNGALDVDAVTNIPALFASETCFRGTQDPARVGRLTRVRLVGTEYQFDYVLDPDIRPIPNSLLEGLARSLGIEDFEFSRTHWAIKEADLFEALLKAGLGRRQKAKVFDLPDDPGDDYLVAVMMPFDPRFNPVYAALQSAASSVDMHCQRADDIWVHDHIIQDVVSLICKASVVICDLTGRNPNVFYEMGIAHTLGKDVIMITQNAQDVPFDVAHIRHIRYLPNGEGMTSLTSDVTRRLEGLQATRR
jgi:hypothetical protein